MTTFAGKRTNTFSSHVFKFLTYYLLFSMGFIFFFSAMVSVVSFFHFLLEHRFIVIEEWIHRNSWELLFLSKASSAYFIIKFLSIQVGIPDSFKRFFIDGLDFQVSRVVVSIIFMLAAVIFLGKPQLKDLDDVNYLYCLFSFLGAIAFYGFDIFLLAYIRTIFALRRRRERAFLIVSLSIIFYLFNMIVLPFGEKIDALIFANMLFCLFLLELKRGAWSSILVYLILFVAPSFFIFGLDPIWSDQFSLFYFTGPLKAFHWLAIWPIVFVFLWFTREKSCA